MKLHYRKTGSGPADKPAMVFLHGAGGSSRLWASQYQAFRDTTACYFLDLPGHGESLHPVEEPSIDLYAREVMNFIDYLSAPAILVGHSMGGGVALSIALSEPALLQALVLAGTGCGLPVSQKLLTALDTNYDTALDAIIRYCFSKSVNPTLLQHARSEFGKTDPDIVRADFRTCNAFNVCSRLPEISVPTLIICGENDVMTPLAFSQKLHASIPGSRLETISKAGHMPMLEHADIFNNLLRSI